MNSTCGIKDTQAVLQFRCSAAWTSGIQGEFVYLSAFNIFLSITAVLGNILILVALRKASSLECLWLTKNGNFVDAHIHLFIVSYTLSSVSQRTMSAISVDRTCTAQDFCQSLPINWLYYGNLRWLKTVSSTFKDLYYDVSL